jgi:hypothetical protein
MDREIFLRILSFVGGRRKEEGGYGATPLLPATVEDTYHALRILEILGRIHSLRKSATSARHERSLKSYLAGLTKTPWVSSRTTFQVMACALSSGVALDSAKAIEYISRRLTNTLHLGERYYCARILREALNVRDMTTWPKARMPRFFKWRTARELWMKLYLQQGASSIESARKQEIVAWLQACQNSDGGFGFLPRTTSYIENCHTCMRALALLHAKPQDLEGCLHFVLACRTGPGGFARSPGAAPFLDATWHAVAVFSILGFL